MTRPRTLSRMRVSALAAATVLSAPVIAVEADVSAGDWILRGSVANIAPKSDNGTLDVTIQGYFPLMRRQRNV